MASRQDEMARFDSLIRRVEAWERSESNRLRETILVPIFAGSGCVLHNSMIAWEQGKPWAEMPANYYQKGRYFNWKQAQIWDASRRLKDHFYRRYLDAVRAA